MMTAIDPSATGRVASTASLMPDADTVSLPFEVVVVSGPPSNDSATDEDTANDSVIEPSTVFPAVLHCLNVPETLSKLESWPVPLTLVIVPDTVPPSAHF